MTLLRPGHWPGGQTQMHLHTPPLAELLATVLPTRMQQHSDQKISKQHENKD